MSKIIFGKDVVITVNGIKIAEVKDVSILSKEEAEDMFKDAVEISPHTEPVADSYHVQIAADGTKRFFKKYKS